MVELVAAGLALVATATWVFAVPRVVIDDDEAPDFGALVTPLSAAAVGVCAFALAQVLWLVPGDAWWLWAPYLAFGVPLVAVDLRTTFLPTALWRLCLVGLLVGAVPVALTRPPLALAAALGAAAVGAFFYLAWRLGRGMGFGDVRLAVLVGAVAGTSGVMGVASALLLGTALGAGQALLRVALRRGTGAFAYGPALYLGPFAAQIVATATAG